MAAGYPGLGPDKVVLVTAGASGIGRCIAEHFLAENCQVTVCDIDAAAIADCAESNPGMITTQADVGDAEQVADLFQDLERHCGRLDVLVNNAGIAGPSAPVEEVAIRDWQQTLNIDLNGPFYCTRLAVPLLKRQGGSIINMASSAGLYGCPQRSPYVAAKWALNGLTKSWAMELGSSAVRVNAICPGSVNGERIERVLERDAAGRGVDIQQLRDIYTRQSSLGVFVDPEDIAQMALFLASNLGAHISGQAIAIDGHTETLSV